MRGDCASGSDGGPRKRTGGTTSAPRAGPTPTRTIHQTRRSASIPIRSSHGNVSLLPAR